MVLVHGRQYQEDEHSSTICRVVSGLPATYLQCSCLLIQKFTTVCHDAKVQIATQPRPFRSKRVELPFRACPVERLSISFLHPQGCEGFSSLLLPSLLVSTSRSCLCLQNSRDQTVYLANLEYSLSHGSLSSLSIVPSVVQAHIFIASLQ